MKLSRQTLLIFACVGAWLGLLLGASPDAHAETNAQLEAGADLIVATLGNSSLDFGDMLKQIVVGLRVQSKICPDSFWDDVVDCLVGDEDNNYSGALNDFVDYAVKNGKLDPVEQSILELGFTTITSVQGNATSGIVLSTAPRKAIEGSGIPLPSILTYRANKADFAALRTAKGAQAVLPPAVAQQMAKQFPRQIQGVGNVTPEEYFAAQLGRLQLNELAGLMVTASDFLSRPDAKVMFYPANYSVESTELKNDENSEVSLAESIASETDPKQRAALQAQLTALENQTSAAQQADQIDTLTEQRAVANSHLMTDVASLANPKLTARARASLGADLQSTLTQINGIDQKLGDLIRTQNLPPEDVQRLAINSLHSDFQALIQETPFNQMQLVSADALLAAWVSGDVSTDALTALCQFPGLKEVHPNIWTEALSLAWDIAKPALMVFPTTSYVAIAISVMLDIQQSAVTNKEDQSDETHLVPLQP